MFVRSRMEKDVTYRRKGNVWIIKANSVTLIDENKVTAKELKDLYGSRIEIISRGTLDKKEDKKVVKEVKVEKKKEEPKPVRKPLDEMLINDILTEIKDEIPAVKDEPVKKEELKVEIVNPVTEGFMSGVGSIVPPKDNPEVVSMDVIGKLEVKSDELEGLTLDTVKAEDKVPATVDADIDDVVVVEEKPKKSGRKSNGKRRGRAKKLTAK